MWKFHHYEKSSQSRKGTLIEVNEEGLTEDLYRLVGFVRRLNLVNKKKWPERLLEEHTGFSGAKIYKLRRILVEKGLVMGWEPIQKYKRKRYQIGFNEIDLTYNGRGINYSIHVGKDTMAQIEVGPRDRILINVGTGSNSGKIRLVKSDKGIIVYGRPNSDIVFAHLSAFFKLPKEPIKSRLKATFDKKEMALVFTSPDWFPKK